MLISVLGDWGPKPACAERAEPVAAMLCCCLVPGVGIGLGGISTACGQVSCYVSIIRRQCAACDVWAQA